MGRLINGIWHEDQFGDDNREGRFERESSSFRGVVEADPAAPFPAAAGRYHLYVSLACPWAHRTLIVRKLKRLERAISISIVHPVMGRRGWVFGDYPGCLPDAVNHAARLSEIYTRAAPTYTGRVTVPVLWDCVTHTIVNNESADIIRMMNRAFDEWGDAEVDLCPEHLRAEIDEVNARVYAAINNGVYRAGFATTQEAYEEAYAEVFDALDWLEDRLAERRYLVGEQITEADWRLFTTLVRFDSVYVGHFKCNRQRLVDYPNLWSYTRELYKVPGVASTVDLDHIKLHYYRSHERINPGGLVPCGPALDFDAPHYRERLVPGTGSPVGSPA